MSNRPFFFKLCNQQSLTTAAMSSGKQSVIKPTLWTGLRLPWTNVIPSKTIARERRGNAFVSTACKLRYYWEHEISLYSLVSSQKTNKKGNEDSNVSFFGRACDLINNAATGCLVFDLAPPVHHCQACACFHHEELVVAITPPDYLCTNPKTQATAVLLSH